MVVRIVHSIQVFSAGLKEFIKQRCLQLWFKIFNRYRQVSGPNLLVDEKRDDSRTELEQVTSHALASLGEIVKGGKKQCLAEMAVISNDDFVVIDGLRYAIPYDYDKRIRCRKRWEGRKLLDVLNDEFPNTDWQHEIDAGHVVTREGIVSPDFVWNVGKSVWHTRHIHESPTSGEITIVHKDENYLVVDKPPSMPVHPCGRYHRGSLIFQLAARGFRNLRVTHRLDLQTSGIVIFARNSGAATALQSKNKAHNLQKTYLAEVEGNFPHDEYACSEPLNFRVKGKRSHVDHEEGKSAHTDFTKIHYNKVSNTTIVQAKPRTGRQHQIRVHLAHLGYPIVDDPIYGTPPVAESLDENHCLSHPSVPYGDEIRRNGERLDCQDCPHLYPKSLKKRVHPIRLHALRYEGEGFSYETDPPVWATKDLRNNE